MDAFPVRSSWQLLPPEVRFSILSFTIMKSSVDASDYKFPKASVLTTVCREWQSFFEKETFRHLALTSSDLRKFTTVIKRNTVRLDYLRHLRLQIRLINYIQRTCNKPESAADIEQNNHIFTRDIACLLNILSSWEGSQGGLTLEITAHSPSDHKYHMNELELYDDYPFRFEIDLDRYSGGVRKFGEQKREQMTNSIRSRSFLNRTLTKMTLRLRGTPLELQQRIMRKHLPNVPIVQGLVFRPELFRGIAFTSLAKLLRESFINLQSFRLERYIGHILQDDMEFMNGVKTHLLPSLPVSLRRFTFQEWQRWNCYRSWSEGKALGTIIPFLGEACHRFPEFCLPHHMPVERFFGHIIRNKKRGPSRLCHLCLRAKAFNPWRSSQSRVTSLLILAAKAAKKLHQLRVLEIWDARNGFGHLFRFRQDECRATITWRSTYFILERQAIKAWEESSP